MKDSQFVAGVSPLIPSAKDSLCVQISKITQSDLETAKTFVDQIDQALVEHRVIREMVDLEAAKMAEIPKLATNANLAANALEKMDGATAQVILQAARKRVDPDIAGEIANLRSVGVAAKKYFDSIIRRPGGNALSHEDASLISNIARAYATVFCIRPSYAEGPFSKVVRAIYQSADLGRPPEKSALKRVLTSLQFVALPALRRGRKAVLK
jgi:hypothetical protein